MADLRTELEMYTAVDEPPMRITFDEIVTAARSKRQRRRSLIIASGVAAVAAVAVAVPVTVTSHTPATPGPFTTSCPADTGKPEQVGCVVNEFLTEQLPDVRFDPAEVQGRLGTYQASIVVTGSESSLRLTAHRQTPPRGCEERKMPGLDCEQRVGPDGQTIVVIHYPDMTEPDRTAVEVSSSTGTTSLTVHQVEQEPQRLLSVDQLVRLATTPELLP
jgi:hypothetical protein